MYKQKTYKHIPHPLPILVYAMVSSILLIIQNMNIYSFKNRTCIFVF
ncbi:hypothetical protein HMPREF9144_2559 [Prevotella pallens ATCC 700821]|uniref:Uncharacterized protein n=1 Tax=Prevotella pallens ATCC 700821 TaxID=997353 RepID=F9DLL7_9BACT|nr:hypothetical protein HMPREF9144_2559 [Prevotella pallens ATCC 700821]